MRNFGTLLAAILSISIGSSTLSAQQRSVRAPDVSAVPIVLLMDATSGQVLFEKNSGRRFAPASITKVMTAFTAFEMIASGELSPRQTFTVRPETFREWSGKGSTMYLPHDARVTVDTLLLGVMSVSANDGSIVLAEGAAGSVSDWTEFMNANARKLGLEDSHFATPNGWMDEGKTFVSASDLARLARAMIERHPKKYARYIGNSEFTYNDIKQYNRDPLIRHVAGADGIKTGYTDEAGMGYLGSVRRGGDRLIVVVAGVDRQSERNRAARELIEWGFERFDHRMVFGRGVEVGSARVQNGSSRSVGLKSELPIHVSVPKGTNPDVEMRIRYDGPLKAPIKAGEQVAELELIVEGMPSSRIPLVATETVGEAGLLSRVWNGLAGWFT